MPNGNGQVSIKASLGDLDQMLNILGGGQPQGASLVPPATAPARSFVPNLKPFMPFQSAAAPATTAIMPGLSRFMLGPLPVAAPDSTALPPPRPMATLADAPAPTVTTPTTATPSRGPSFGRRALGVLGKIGEAAGTFLAPEVTMLVPGTELHKELQQRERAGEAEIGKIQAETGKTQAEAEEAKAHGAFYQRQGTRPTVIPGVGYIALNPDTQQWELQRVTGEPTKPETLDQAEAQLLMDRIAKGVPSLEALQEVYAARAAGKTTTENLEKQLLKAEQTLFDPNATPEQKAIAQQTVSAAGATREVMKPPTKLEHVSGTVDGKLTEANYDPGTGKYSDPATGADISASFKPSPSFAQTGLYRPEVVITPEGQAVTMGYDARTGKMVPINVPGGGTVVAPGSIGGQQYQAVVIDDAAKGLIQEIQANRKKLGNVESIVNSAFLGTPLADPTSARLAALLGSFAALQPRLHNFRGQGALTEFRKLIGGIPTNPDALIASIQALQQIAGAVGGGIVPKEAGPTAIPGGTAPEKWERVGGKLQKVTKGAR